MLALYGVIAAWLARAVVGRTRAVAEAAKAHAEAAAANTVRQAQERFRLVVEANTNGLLVADKAGQLVLVNPALARMFGYDAEELLGQPLDILLPDAVKSGHGRQFAGYMGAPAARPMGQGRELRGRRKDGSEFPIEISLSPFTENGELFVDAFVADISERKRSEQLHQKIEARLQLMMQTNPNGLLVADDQGAIEMANPALERMFGYAPGELLNQSLERLVPKDSQHRHSQLRQILAQSVDTHHGRGPGPAWRAQGWHDLPHRGEFGQLHRGRQDLRPGDGDRRQRPEVTGRAPGIERLPPWLPLVKRGGWHRNI